MKNKIILAILDGFGFGDNNPKTNAIFKADTPFLDQLLKTHNSAKLYASEEYVGIAKGQFGNSEIGHMTIGSGQIIYGIGEYATKLINDNQFDNYLDSQTWVKNILENNEVVHLCGMYSKGSVHSNLIHMDAMIKYFEKHNIKIGLHLFSDGRDTSKYVFYDDIKNLLSWIKPTTKIISIAGRYYGMDRDQRWERTNQSFNAIIQKESKTNLSVLEYIKSQYDSGNDDEFLIPVYFENNEYLIKPKQTLCFLNYRADRIRQMFHKFKKTELYDASLVEFNDVNVVSIGKYPSTEPDYYIFDEVVVNNTLGSVLIENNIRQLRIAETEKYAHVTFFFDGGKEVKHPLQKNVLIPSPKVATYDLKPEMAAEEITNKILELIDEFDVCIVNYANADMVGHTGNFEATVKAVEILDKQLQKLYNTIVFKYNGSLVITADHGNADCMVHNDKIVKTHTLALVPFIVASNEFELNEYSGSLQDITPSLLFMLGLNQPSSMTGHSLVKKK